MIEGGAQVNFTGTVNSVGDSLDILGVANFIPAVPTTLTTSECTVDDAYLVGIDNLVVTGMLTLVNGILETSGTTDAEGGITITGAILEYGTLNNYGTAAWTGGTVTADNGAVFNNESGATFDAQSDASFGWDGSGAVPTFNNLAGASFVKSGGSGPSGTQMSLVFNNAGAVVVQSGSLQLGGSFPGGQPVMNSGTVSIGSGTTLGTLSEYDQTAGSTTLDGGTFSGGDLNIEGGALSGSGTINANVTNASEVFPGGGGALTINGSYTQAGAGALDVAVGGSTAGSGYSQLVVNGAATIDGVLVVSSSNGFAATFGQTFTILSAPDVSGEFATVNETEVTGPLAFQPTYPGAGVVLVAEDSSTTTLASSVTSSTYGQSVTFTATVKPTPPNKGTPTGSVTFFDGSMNLGSVTLSSGKAMFKTTSLAVGSRSVNAVYSGDTTFATSSSAALAETVSQDSATAKVTPSANPAVYGETVTFTATVKAVSPGSGTPTGTVTFDDGGTPIGTGTLSGGVATFSTAFVVVGSHSITDSYGGDLNFTGSSSTALSETVNQAAASTVVTVAPNPSVYGESLTLTATVSATAPGSGTPTGTVTFTQGANVLGTATLSNGTVSITSSVSIPVGTDTIKAAYSGDTNFKTSTGTVSETVGQDSTTTAVESSANPSVFGQSVTFTATVTANAPGSGTPTGSVTFVDGTTKLGTVALSGGTATYTTAKLPTGSDAITVTYNGNTDFSTSGASLTQTVNQDGTTAVVTSSLNPSTSGQKVTFTVVVSAAAPGAGTPTGTVTFYDGLAPLGTGTLSGGKATLSTKTLAVGSHSITVMYGGDTNFLGSTSAVLTQTVNGVGGNSVTADGLAVDAAIGALSADEWGTALIDDLAGEQVSVGGRRAFRMD